MDDVPVVHVDGAELLLPLPEQTTLLDLVTQSKDATTTIILSGNI